MKNGSFQESLLVCSVLIQKKISELLPPDFADSKIVEAMRYSALSDGKRIRPFLLISCAELFGVSVVSSLQAAVAVEFIHTYSLIHDDLPAMDNDDFRRGLLTSHKKFDEATAILAGDGLLTYAFEILSNPQTHQDARIRCELIATLAKSSGFRGMVGGQMIDLENADKKISKEQIANLHRQKTGELFMASCEMGAILGEASKQQRDKLRFYAHDIGLAFQIRDDILDHEEQKEKKVNFDAMKHKKKQENASIVDVVGIESANKQLKMLSQQAKEHIKVFGNQAEILIELADFVSSRSY
jgi:farnesyl diphosphate synthase